MSGPQLMIWVIILVAAMLFSYLLTSGVRTYGLTAQWLDYPNARSSHSKPTPQGGGLSIVITITVGVLLLWLAGLVDSPLALVMTSGGVAVAAVGFLDDRGSMPVSRRLAVHGAAAIWAMYVLGSPRIGIGHRAIDLGIYGYALGVLAIVWTLNLFNFMDGIDGIAASEAIFVAGAGAVLTWGVGSPTSVAIVALLIVAASCGFLPWNWPPARIFMGDVGSGYLGYMIGVVALAAARDNSVALYQWLILGGVFFADATVTLLRRLLKGESIHIAHRSHAYQRLARRWRSHRRVTLAAWALNIGWLLPFAWFAAVASSFAWLITLVALVPVVCCVILAGAGQHETEDATCN